MKIAWSNFARDRHQPGKGFSYFNYNDEALFKSIEHGWGNRVIGDGAESIDDVCIVPVNPSGFVCTTLMIEDAVDLYASIDRRSPEEAPFVRVNGYGPATECKFAKVVLYAAHELEKNDGERSSDADWEIICIIASDTEDEPMHPLAMARNQLEKVGGTPRQYSPVEWANAVWYWSQRLKQKG